MEENNPGGSATRFEDQEELRGAGGMTQGAKATGLRGPEARGASAVYSIALAEIEERIRKAKLPVTADFSAFNLWRMKGFFETYRDAGKLAPLARKVGCSAGPENLNAEAVRLAATIKRNFEELGV